MSSPGLRPSRPTGPARVAIFVGLWALAAPSNAQAQVEPVERANFALDRMIPGMDREAILNVESGEVPLHLAYDAALWMGFSQNLLLLARRNPDGSAERVGALVGPRFGAHLTGAVALMGWVELGLSLPVVFFQDRGAEPPADVANALRPLSAGGIGDLRFSPKIRILTRDRHAVDLAVIPVLTFPTQVPRQSYLGERSMTVVPTLAVSRPFGFVRAAFNLGYRWRRSLQVLDLTVGPEIDYRAGAAIDLNHLAAVPVEISATLSGSMSAAEPFQNVNTNPLELLLGGRYQVNDAISVDGGLGIGLVAGFGVPDFRIFAALRYAPRPSDKDGDRVADDRDGCPDVPEDPDGFEDSDGCPDLDNDGDGFPDDVDKCPDEPESPNGEQDDDGCPENLRIKRVEDRFEISNTVQFEFGKSTIKTQSHELLREVARELLAHPDIKKIRIEGHTDDRGRRKANVWLSQERAEAVRQFMIQEGLPPEMFEAKGFGPDKPRANNKTERGRAMNRRVEFIIIEREE